MSESKVGLRYVGDVVAGGEMDVFDLAPALLDFGRLCQSVGESILGPDSQVTVRISSEFKARSFEAVLRVVETVMPAAAPLLAYVASEGSTAADRIVDVVVGPTKSFKESLLSLWKKLRGSAPEKVERKADGGVVIQGNNNTVVLASDQAVVAWLYTDEKVREQIAGMVRPAASPRMKHMEARRDDKPVIQVSSEEARPTEAAAPEEPAEPEQVSTYTAIVEVIRAVLVGRSQWDVREGESRYRASVADDLFLRQVDAGAVAFRHPCMLRVQLRLLYRRKPDGTRAVERTVLKVIEMLPPDGGQMTLPETTA